MRSLRGSFHNEASSPHTQTLGSNVSPAAPEDRYGDDANYCVRRYPGTLSYSQERSQDDRTTSTPKSSALLSHINT